MYQQRTAAKTLHKKRNALRDIAVIELLFASGMRISELCGLRQADINLPEKTILIYGKGSKERRIQIGNNDVVSILDEYNQEYRKEIESCCHFFVNHRNRPLSDQAVRRMINKYTDLAAISLHITPHMFRHPYVKPTTKKFLSFFKFEMAISLRAFLCFALLLSIKEGPQFVPSIW